MEWFNGISETNGTYTKQLPLAFTSYYAVVRCLNSNPSTSNSTALANVQILKESLSEIKLFISTGHPCMVIAIGT